MAHIHIPSEIPARFLARNKGANGVFAAMVAIGAVFSWNFGIRKTVCERVGQFDAMLGRKGSDNTGGEEVDFYRRLLDAVIRKFDGGPVGVESLAAAIGEERGTIEDVLEPYLIQQGFLMRTPRGRIATRASYLHFGLKPPRTADSQDLFADLEDN